MSSRAQRGICTLTLLLLAAGDALAQRDFGRRRDFMGGDPNEYWVPPDFAGNTPYDGRITFARIKYRGYEHFQGREGPGWSHDYPRAEEHFMRIIKEITTIRPFVEKGPMIGGVIVSLEDKDLFKYPVAYFSEPGGWHPNEAEIAGLRTYLTKGGFVIFDDFDSGGGFRGAAFGREWIRFQDLMRQVLPKHRLIEIAADHPVFDSFYKINFSLLERTGYGVMSYWGIFQDNDPKKRLMAVVNLNGDLGEFWQWSGEGYNIAPTNEAYKLGVNYLIYALTH
jgi:hypothetical protein